MIFLKAFYTLLPVLAEVYIYKIMPLYSDNKSYTLDMLTYRLERSLLLPIRRITVDFFVFYSASWIHLVVF